MKINIQSPLCAEIFLDGYDLEMFGIDFDLFDSDEFTAQLFISNLAAFLSEIGAIEFNSENIACTIRQTDSGMHIRLENEENSTDEYMIIFDDSEGLTDYVNTNHSKIEECKLYKTDKGYALIINGQCDSHRFDYITSECIINKTREYGYLLSDTPVKKLINLREN